jgi:hypothetical protein
LEAARTLNNHWAKRFTNAPIIRDILGTFVNFYVLNPNNMGWFAGFHPFGSTNNGLESANRDFKDRDSFRRKLPLREFFEVASSAVHKWSVSPDLQVFN